ncbi:hypothetical protein D9611_012527 [Ephemerocybe angulata]|uniref:Uncharacterized protein n=1 Tax=Ephemerocybe angulata TaxID=980116 RepID=A0A8H5FJ68_9AGAR|nr:hypothetical protein D9611_012527 [Tulosesus angulatus]
MDALSSEWRVTVTYDVGDRVAFKIGDSLGVAAFECLHQPMRRRELLLEALPSRISKNELDPSEIESTTSRRALKSLGGTGAPISISLKRATSREARAAFNGLHNTFVAVATRLEQAGASYTY